MTSQEQQLRVSQNYRLHSSGGDLLIQGGADAIYTIELDSKETIFTTIGKQPFSIERLSEADKIICEQLLVARIVEPVIAIGKLLKVYMVGDLQLTVGKACRLVKSPTTADVIVIVRSKRKLEEFLQNLDYQNIKQPHLFVDLAYHHTISIGPLVFPGSTACLSCLYGRLKQRWGDDEPPTQPQAAEQLLELTQALLAIELQKIAQQNMDLINKTVTWNTETREVSSHSLGKVLACPVCAQNKQKLDFSGRIELPW